MSGPYQTLHATRQGRTLFVRLDRPDAFNAINTAMLRDLDAVLDSVEADDAVRSVVLEGQNGVFCTGMDLAEAVEGRPKSLQEIEAGARLYFRILRRLATSPRAVIARIDGRVEAGGIGFVAASDHVLAAPASTFRLSEAVLGLMPACVMPFLKRRIGFQQARWMALSAASVDAARAERIGLVDQVADRLDEAVRRQLLAVERVPARTFARIKAYADRLSPIDLTTEDAAVGEIASLLDDPASRAIIEELMRQGLWQGAGADRAGGGS